MVDDATRIAMWSGPRNISTALMRSWGNRPDTFVCDEPLYAYYLTRVDVDHPGAAEIVEHHETDSSKVVAWLTGPIPEGREIFYQKHMAHHLLDDVERGWLSDVVNCFLIRDPREMLLSLSKVLPDPQLRDTGLEQQVEIFDRISEQTGTRPPVIDSKDVLLDPPRMLARLCDAIGVPYRESMLAWPAGRRETDGVWAPHWYSSVERSTGFQGYQARADLLPERLEPLLEQCLPFYRRLFEHRL